MEAFISFMRPFLRVIAGAARMVLRPFGAGAALGSERVHSAEELKLLVTASLQLGQLSGFQEEVIQRVLDLHQVPVREVMTARHEMLALPVQTSLEAALEFIVEHRRSRYPVFDQDLDHPVGLLYAKDLLRVFSMGQLRPGLANRTLRSLLRPLRVVPESKPLDQLLLEFQRGRAHLVAVVDEFGTLTGVVTVEDILEEIVGEVEDEYDIAQPLAPLLADEPADVDALSGIRELEAQYGIEFPREDTYETLAGFLLLRLGHIPQPGEQVSLGPYRFTVLSMEGHRIGQVRIERTAPDSQPAGAHEVQPPSR
jgi:CBS domain containing-hemolysin-like protein